MKQLRPAKNHEQVKTLEPTMQFGAAGGEPRSRAGSAEDVLGRLVERLGGSHAVVEQLTAALDLGAGPLGIDEDTEGYCYLRLFDAAERQDAVALGPCPTVAEVRRFSNGRADPFGNRSVVVEVRNSRGGRLGHITFDDSSCGLRPIVALAALSKDLRVGLPDGVTEEFPPDWVPHDKKVAQTWDYIIGGQVRNLDALGWLGDRPGWLSGDYEPISHPTSRIRWILRANPLGPPTATIDIIDPRGKVVSVRQWESYVAHTGHHQGWQVRGSKVFAEAYIWRAARVLTDPSAPLPTPPPPEGHGDLFGCGLQFTRVEDRPTVRKGGQPCVRMIPTVDSDVPGFCYGHAFRDPGAAILALGAFPTVGMLLSYVRRRDKFAHLKDANPTRRAWLVGSGPGSDGVGVVHHVANDATEGDVDFWDAVHTLGKDDRVGATQSTIVKASDIEDVNGSPVLAIRPRTSGVIINVPFVAILELNKETLLWDVKESRKLGIIMSYYESVEMVSLKMKATVHKGDNSTLLTVVADTFDTALTLEHDWVGAAHTLHVAGNVNGATTGEMVLERNHGFGVQLKGVAVGAPTPIIQAKLETTVTAKAYIKIMLALRVAGSGLPRALMLPTKAAKGGFAPAARRAPEPESSAMGGSNVSVKRDPDPESDADSDG